MRHLKRLALAIPKRIPKFMNTSLFDKIAIRD
jgi:hypothetical protein